MGSASLVVILSYSCLAACVPESSRFSTEFEAARKAWRHGDIEQSEKLLEAAVAAANESEQSSSEFIDALGLLSEVRIRQGRVEAAVEPATRRLQLARRLYGDENWSILEETSRLAQLCHQAGRYETAITLWNELIALSSRIEGGKGLFVGSALVGLGRAYEAQRRYEDARAHYDRAIGVLDAQGGATLMLALEGDSRVERALGNDERAEQLSSRAEDLRRSLTTQETDPSRLQLRDVDVPR